MKLIGRGAEAEVYEDKDSVVKKRVEKDYRIKEIDAPIRRFRTKREGKVIDKLKVIGIPVPSVESVDVDKGILKIEKIKGVKLRDKLNTKNYSKLCKDMGKMIAEMHNNDVIHGDLTTSNMIFENKLKKIFLIDFGLSFFSSKVEDKAVDIHLFRQALESKHNQFWEKGFKVFISGYGSKSEHFKEIMGRFDQVENRGRNKGKG